MGARWPATSLRAICSLSAKSRPSAPRFGERITLRSTSSVWIFVVLSAIGAFLIGDAMVREAFSVWLVDGPWTLLVILAGYATLARPRVVVSGDGLLVVNILRVHHIPWSRVADLTSRFQLTVHLDDGRKVTSWGAPAVGVERPTALEPLARQTAGQQRASGVRRPTVKAAPAMASALVISRARDRWEAGRDHSAGSAGSVGSTDEVSTFVTWWFVYAAAVLSALCVGTLLFAH
jgi:hypothetical protein